MQLKIINTAITLKEFTSQKLATLTEAPLKTVQSIIARHQDLFQEHGKEPTGKPGGQPIIYRVTDRAAQFVEARVAAVAELDARLQAEYQSLLFEAPKLTLDEAHKRFERTRTTLRDLEVDNRESPEGPESLEGLLHTPVLDALVVLSERELDPRVSVDNAITACTTLRRAAYMMNEHGYDKLARQLHDRIDQSRLMKLIEDKALAAEKAEKTKAARVPRSEDSGGVDLGGRVAKSVGTMKGMGVVKDKSEGVVVVVKDHGVVVKKHGGVITIDSAGITKSDASFALEAMMLVDLD